MNARYTKTLWTTALLSLAVAGVLSAPRAAVAGPAAVDGRVLLKVQSGVSETQYADLLKRNMAREIDRLSPIGLRIVEVPKCLEAAIVRDLSADPRVRFAELDQRAEPSAYTPNDTYYSYEWHQPKIGAPSAWDTTMGEGVTVAVIDSGIDVAHPDLAGRVSQRWNLVSANQDVTDLSGHGTKVAGIIGGEINNALGVAGVAAGVSLMAVRISEAVDGSTTSSVIAAGIVWAADHGARVANVSYDVTMSGTVATAAEYMRSLGGVVLVPAGNDGLYVDHADNTSVITVGATDSNDQIPSWSNYGNIIDVVAPGSAIVTTSVGGYYASATGTSFATPVAAGVAALIIAANPDLSAADVEQILKQSAVDVGAPGWDVYAGAGRVNAAAAVQMALAWNPAPADTQAPTVAISSPAAGAQVSGTVVVQITASDNVGVTSVKLYAGSTLIGTATAAPYAINLNTTTYANGALQLSARAYDAAGNEALGTVVDVTVGNVAQDTTAPTAAITAPTANKTVSGTVSVKSIAADNVAVATMTLYIDNVQLCTGTSTALNCSWNTTSVTRGTHVIKLTATDTSNNSTTTSVSVKR